MSYKFLDSTGITWLIGKIKSLIGSGKTTVNGQSYTEITSALQELSDSVGSIDRSSLTYDTLTGAVESVENDVSNALSIAGSGQTTVNNQSYTELTSAIQALSDVLGNITDLEGLHESTFVNAINNLSTNLGTLASVAKSGSYNDLTDTPTIPSKKVWYGTVSNIDTSESKVTRITIATTTGDFFFEVGNALYVPIAISTPSTGIYFTVDEDSERVFYKRTTTSWFSGALVCLACDGSGFSMIDNHAAASTSNYGLAKLTSSVTSTSTTLAANAYAVKKAYNAGIVESGTSNNWVYRRFGDGTMFAWIYQSKTASSSLTNFSPAWPANMSVSCAFMNCGNTGNPSVHAGYVNIGSTNIDAWAAGCSSGTTVWVYIFAIGTYSS